VNKTLPKKLIKTALDELIVWDELARSPQLIDFLKYIVNRRIKNEIAGIKAYTIAVDVFGRSADFDPQSDPIVRVQGRRLRKLLDRFYSEGKNKVPVRIHIPVGRYVPEFLPIPEGADATKLVEALNELDSESLVDDQDGTVSQTTDTKNLSDETVQDVPKVNSARHDRNFNWRLICISTLSFLAILLLVAGAAFLAQKFYAGLNAGQKSIDSATPLPPAISIGTFTNLTGDPLVDSSIKGLGLQLQSDLSRFHDLVVHQPAEEFNRSVIDEFSLSGDVRQSDYGTEFNILLSRASTGEIVWSTTVVDFMAIHDFPLIISTVSRKVSAALGSYRGPLHRNARLWFLANMDAPVEPSQYACGMLLNLSRDGISRVAALKAEACFKSLLAKNPELPIALAALARIETAKIMMNSQPGDSLTDKLFEVTQSARLARDLMPQSSFVHTILASILAVQSRIDEASVEFMSAVHQNSSDVDARAQFGLTLYFNGDWVVGRTQMEMALADAPAPPPWFYTIRALEAMRTGDYDDAIANALIVTRTDAEIGLILTLAAAPQAGRLDVVARFLPSLLDNPSMQSQGILPRLSRRVRDERILKMLGYGLLLAGVPSETISTPFVVNSSGK